MKDYRLHETTELERLRFTARAKPVLDSQAPRPNRGKIHHNGKPEEKRAKQTRSNETSISTRTRKKETLKNRLKIPAHRSRKVNIIRKKEAGYKDWMAYNTKSTALKAYTQ